MEFMCFDDLKILDYEAFILFNGTGANLSSEDVLFKGMDIIQVVDEVIYELSNKKEDKYISVYNILFKVRKMLEMSNFKDIVMTKFICKKRNSFLVRTMAEEKFCSLNIYLGVFPKQNIEDLLHNEVVDINVDELFEDEEPPLDLEK